MSDDPKREGRRPGEAEGAVSSHPPGAWPAARRLALRLKRPIDQFLEVEAAGGIVLLAATAVALVWANSPWHESYDHLRETRLVVGLGEWRFDKTLHFWINEFLMTVFFLVAGLEIRRELAEGELSTARRAALPLAAALGGMVVPALIYLALNGGGPARRGFGVPMATDIAFAVGVLALLGKRAPPALRVLLLAVAIVDDMGAILVIAIFYSSGLATTGLIVAAAGVALLALLRIIGARTGASYLAPLLVLWVGLHVAGIHPTLAGVIVGLAAPVEPWLGRKGFAGVAREAIADFERRSAHESQDDHALLESLDQLAFARREAVSPVVQAASTLHPYVAYGIVPLFALANAGVYLSGLDTSAEAAVSLLAGIAIGLAIGKPVGIVALSWISVRLGLCAPPRGTGWLGVLTVGCVGGIGFTMAIFVAELAFATPGQLAMAKAAVLGGTAISAVAGLAVGRAFLHPAAPGAGAETPFEAEGGASNG